eukprot:11547509-Alexandrium_andersonii.AAC.1
MGGIVALGLRREGFPGCARAELLRGSQVVIHLVGPDPPERAVLKARIEKLQPPSLAQGKSMAGGRRPPQRSQLSRPPWRSGRRRSSG